MTATNNVNTAACTSDRCDVTSHHTAACTSHQTGSDRNSFMAVNEINIHTYYLYIYTYFVLTAKSTCMNTAEPD